MSLYGLMKGELTVVGWSVPQSAHLGIHISWQNNSLKCVVLTLKQFDGVVWHWKDIKDKDYST